MNYELNTDFSMNLHNNYEGEAHLPFFFEVGRTGDDGSFVPKFYLLGTQHNLPKELVEQRLKRVLPKFDVLVKEIIGGTFGDASDISLKELRLHGLASENLPDWTKYLGQEAQKYFSSEIQGCIKNTWNIEPHLISPVVVNQVVEDWGLGDFYGEGMDLFIEKEFGAQKKEVYSLENGKIRFDAYDTLFLLNKLQQEKSIEENVSLLETTILSWAKNKNVNIQGDQSLDFSSYFSGNIYDKCSFNISKPLCKRNLAWIESIENYLHQHKGKTILFLFGYAHFGGTYGIIRLLENIGYEVKRLYS